MRIHKYAMHHEYQCHTNTPPRTLQSTDSIAGIRRKDGMAKGYCAGAHEGARLTAVQNLVGAVANRPLE